jgi:hypothetical protein
LFEFSLSKNKGKWEALLFDFEVFLQEFLVTLLKSGVFDGLRDVIVGLRNESALFVICTRVHFLLGLAELGVVEESQESVFASHVDIPLLFNNNFLATRKINLNFRVGTWC